MMKFLVQALAASTVTATLAACSGGSGGGSGAGSNAVASGALSVPDIKCGSSACLTSSATMMAGTGLSSDSEVAEYGVSVYDHFNTVALPKVNESLYRVEEAFKKLGYTTCSEIVAIPDVSEQSLDTNYTVDVASYAMTSPFGGTTSKTFIVKYSSSPVLYLSIG